MPTGERGVERRGGERWIAGLGPEAQLGRRTSRMKIERAERARIVEHDARLIGEHDRGASEARKRIGGAIQVPVARHAKVGVQHAAVVEMNELVLASPFDGTNARAAQ